MFPLYVPVAVMTNNIVFVLKNISVKSYLLMEFIGFEYKSIYLYTALYIRSCHGNQDGSKDFLFF